MIFREICSVYGCERRLWAKKFNVIGFVRLKKAKHAWQKKVLAAIRINICPCFNNQGNQIIPFFVGNTQSSLWETFQFVHFVKNFKLYYFFEIKYLIEHQSVLGGWGPLIRWNLPGQFFAIAWHFLKTT